MAKHPRKTARVKTAWKGSASAVEFTLDMGPTGKIRPVVLGEAGGTSVQLIRAMSAGCPFEFLDKLSGSPGMSFETIAETVQIPPRTLSRRKVERRLQPDESERLLLV